MTTMTDKTEHSTNQPNPQPAEPGKEPSTPAAKSQKPKALRYDFRPLGTIRDYFSEQIKQDQRY